MSGSIRSLGNKIERFLKLFPVVLLTGVRQCGKTTLIRSLRPDWKYFDLEKGSDYDRVSRDYDFFFKEHPRHLIIDEAQTAPRLFNELRGVIDQDRHAKGRFILSGSSSLELQQQISESLAGRVAMIELGTLKMSEFYKRPLPAFYNIFEHKINLQDTAYLKHLQTDLALQDVKNFFLRGGYPEPVLSKDPDFFKIWMEQYFDAYVHRDIQRLFPKLNKITFRRFIMMLGALSGTIVNRAELGRSLDISEVTVKEYLDIAHGTFVWRNVPAFHKSGIRSLIKSPKGYIRDAGLNHFLLKINSTEDLENHPRVGTLFEAFVMEEIIKGLGCSNVVAWNNYYYRTKNGAEIDLILEGDFGLVPIEIKYGIHTPAPKLKALSQFVKNHHLPFGIVINQGDAVEMLNDHIIQIPAALI